MLYEVTINGKNYRLDLNRADGRWTCRLDGRDIAIDAVLARPDVLSLRVGSKAYEIKSERIANESYLWVGNTRFTVEIRDPRSLRGRARSGDNHGPKKITAAMPGKVVRLLVREGDEVEPGAGVAVVEAMKMQNEIRAPKAGTIDRIFISEGQAVAAGDPLVTIK